MTDKPRRGGGSRDSPMPSSDELTRALVASLHERLRVPAEAPWSPLDEQAVEAELRRVLERIREVLKLACRHEFDHYGSGYASYVDAWFFRPTDAFRRHPATCSDEYTGLAVLLSRLGPFYCMLEGWKAGSARVGACSLPSFESVDVFETEAVVDLAAKVERELSFRGFVRLSRHDLEAFLPSGASVETNLADGPLREFDLLFHWMD